MSYLWSAGKYASAILSGIHLERGNFLGFALFLLIAAVCGGFHLSAFLEAEGGR